MFSCVETRHLWTQNFLSFFSVMCEDDDAQRQTLRAKNQSQPAGVRPSQAANGSPQPVILKWPSYKETPLLLVSLFHLNLSISDSLWKQVQWLQQIFAVITAFCLHPHWWFQSVVATLSGLYYRQQEAPANITDPLTEPRTWLAEDLLDAAAGRIKMLLTPTADRKSRQTTFY